MIEQDRRTHLLKPGGGTRIPRHHAFLDVETRAERAGPVFRESWRLACATRVTGDPRRGWTKHPIVSYRRPYELLADVLAWTPNRGRLIVWCHNLSFDLRASQLIELLPAAGFTLEQINLDGQASWARFRDHDRTVMFCDLASWLPAPLHQIGRDLGMTQHGTPRRDAPEGVWARRCAQDVRILTAAVMSLIGWVEDQDLGSLRPTGAGQAYAAWRKNHLTHPPLVHDVAPVLEAERRAMWTGRCEAWRHGQLTAGPWTEFDLPVCYPTIAADSEVPCKLRGTIAQPTVSRTVDLTGRYRVLADVEMDLDLEVCPAWAGDHIHWPIGHVRSWLWDPELLLALRYARDAVVHEAVIYEPAPALKSAADWILGQLTDPASGATALQRRALKHWARALIGRVALRYRQWDDFAAVDGSGLSLGLIQDGVGGPVSDMMQVGGTLRVLSGMVEADESLPQITGWIMAEARRRLWRLIEVAGAGNVAYMDTDSVIVDARGAQRLLDHLRTDPLWGLRRKATYRRLEIRGPRMLVLDDTPRIAGIPKTAVPDGHGGYHAEIFLGLREAVLRGAAGTVEVMPRTFTLSAPDRRRTHVPGGRTIPNTQEVSC